MVRMSGHITSSPTSRTHHSNSDRRGHRQRFSKLKKCFKHEVRAPPVCFDVIRRIHVVHTIQPTTQSEFLLELLRKVQITTSMSDKKKYYTTGQLHEQHSSPALLCACKIPQLFFPVDDRYNPVMKVRVFFSWQV